MTTKTIAINNQSRKDHLDSMLKAVYNENDNKYNNNKDDNNDKSTKDQLTWIPCSRQ